MPEFAQGTSIPPCGSAVAAAMARMEPQSVTSLEQAASVPPPSLSCAAADGASDSVRATTRTMAPSLANEPSYRPVPGRPGQVEYLDDDVDFVGFQTAEGWFEGGEFQIVFEHDGTTEAVDLVLRSGDEPGFVLQISPVVELVRILDEEA